MSFLSDTISSKVKADSSELTKIVSSFSRAELSRKSVITRVGEVARQLVLIESGYLRMYRVDGGKDNTLLIAGKGKFITAVGSFVNQQPSRWNIEALTDSTIHTIKRDSHFALCRQYRCWLDFENMLLSKAIDTLEFRNFELMTLKAEDRFRHLFERNPTLFLEVPSKYIASMLGISQETISRLKQKTKDFS